MNQKGGIELRHIFRERGTMYPEPIEARQLFNMVLRRKWPILIFAVLATAAAAAVVYRIKPAYRASSTVMIESKQVNVVSIQEVFGVDTKAPDYFENQLEVMRSRPIIDRVTEKLDLNSNPLLSGDDSAPGTDIFHWYRKHLRIDVVPRTQLVTVIFDAPDPQLAADIVNAHVQAFIENYRINRDAETRLATSWMSERVEELRKRLSEAEARLQAFRERERLIDIDGFQALPARQINELTSKLTDAKRDLSQTGNDYAQVLAVRDASLKQKLTIPAIRSDQLVQQLRQAHADAELKVAEASRRYGPKHPRMRAALTERASIEQSLENQVNNVMEAIGNQHDALKGQTQSISTAIDSVKTDAQLVARKGTEYRELMREVEINRQLFDMFYKRVSETTEAGNFDTVNARVIEPAMVPLAPRGLPQAAMIAAAFVGAVGLGGLIAIFLELFDRTIKHAIDLERRIGVPLLGYVPRVRSSKGSSVAQQFGNHKNREFAEAIRTLRTGVKLSSINRQQKLVILTSSIAAEGKTSIACNLALSFAQSERVLLVDADMRRPAVARELGLQGKLPGLAEVCSGTEAFDDCVIRSFKPNLDVLPAGAIPVDPPELLDSPALGALLQRFRKDYDRIVFDCPPVLPVSDVLLLANQPGYVVYVVKTGSTLVSQVKAGVRKFAKTEATLIGAVLNQVDPKTLMAYGEYGGGYYGDYSSPQQSATT